MPKDGLWAESEHRLPVAWPEKAVLPITVMNGAAPEQGKFRLLAMDEVVVSFWLFLGHSLDVGAELAKRIAAEETEALTAQKKPNGEQLQEAQLLARNAIFRFVIMETEDARLAQALTYREQLAGCGRRS